MATRILRAAAKKAAAAKAKKKALAKAKAAKRRGARPSDRLSKSVRKAPIRWRIPANLRRRYDSFFTDIFGKSPRGTTWSALAERYPERFRDYIDQMTEEE
jgi:hypothetical protein